MNIDAKIEYVFSVKGKEFSTIINALKNYKNGAKLAHELTQKRAESSHRAYMGAQRALDDFKTHLGKLIVESKENE